MILVRVRQPHIVVQGAGVPGQGRGLEVRRGTGDGDRPLRAHRRQHPDALPRGVAADRGEGVFGNDNTINGYLDIDFGDATLLADWIYVCDFDHRYADVHMPIKDQGIVKSPVSIGPETWIGTKVTMLRGARCGGGCVLGAHAVVRGDIAPTRGVGAPAAWSATGTPTTTPPPPTAPPSRTSRARRPGRPGRRTGHVGGRAGPPHVRTFRPHRGGAFHSYPRNVAPSGSWGGRGRGRRGPRAEKRRQSRGPRSRRRWTARRSRCRGAGGRRRRAGERPLVVEQQPSPPPRAPARRRREGRAGDAVDDHLAEPARPRRHQRCARGSGLSATMPKGS